MGRQSGQSSRGFEKAWVSPALPKAGRTGRLGSLRCCGVGITVVMVAALNDGSACGQTP